jgi:hypothetical protein
MTSLKTTAGKQVSHGPHARAERCLYEFLQYSGCHIQTNLLSRSVKGISHCDNNNPSAGRRMVAPYPLPEVVHLSNVLHRDNVASQRRLFVPPLRPGVVARNAVAVWVQGSDVVHGASLARGGGFFNEALGQRPQQIGKIGLKAGKAIPRSSGHGMSGLPTPQHGQAQAYTFANVCGPVERRVPRACGMADARSSERS